MLISGLILWYSTRQASINGNGKVAPAPLSSILCVAIEFPSGMKVPIKNADDNNNNNTIDTFESVLKSTILARFEDIDYSSSQGQEAFMASPHDLCILYSNPKKRTERQRRGLTANQSLYSNYPLANFVKVRLRLPHDNRSQIRKMSAQILALTSCLAQKY